MNKPSHVDELFELAMEQMRRDMAASGCPEFVIARTVARQCRDFEWSKRAVEKVLRSAAG
jgi:DNA polymerase III delta subunit